LSIDLPLETYTAKTSLYEYKDGEQLLTGRILMTGEERREDSQQLIKDVHNKNDNASRS